MTPRPKRPAPAAKAPRPAGTRKGRAPRAVSAVPPVSASALARLLGYSREQIRQWTLKGMPRRDDGEYLVADVVSWLRTEAAESAKAKAKGEGGAASLKEQREALELELKQIEVDRIRRELVPTAEFVAELEAAFTRVRGALSAAVSAHAPRLQGAGVASIRDAHELLRAFADEVIEQLHQDADQGDDQDDGALLDAADVDGAAA